MVKDATERGKLQMMILHEILPEIGSGNLIRAMIDVWGTEKAFEFLMNFNLQCGLKDCAIPKIEEMNLKITKYKEA